MSLKKIIIACFILSSSQAEKIKETLRSSMDNVVSLLFIMQTKH